jgi:hypothetical protein
MVENFTISLDQMGNSCAMNISWENTKATVAFAEAK